MNRSQTGLNAGDLFERDHLYHRKTNSNKDGLIEQFVEESDKPSSSSSQAQLRNINVFDYTNIGMFFPQKAHQDKTSFDSSQCRGHSKKISNESNSNKDLSMKASSFTGGANGNKIDELYENTTIISQLESISLAKKKSNDYAQNKILVEENSGYQLNQGADQSFTKFHLKKKSHTVNSSKISHSKESSNDIDNCEIISKKDINEGEEADKTVESNVSKEKSMSTKPPKKGFNIGKVDEKLLESIMSKVNKIKPNNSGSIIYTTLTQENSRTNNLSIFKSLKTEQEKTDKIDKLEKYEKIVSEKQEKISEKSDKIEKFEDKKQRTTSVNQPVYGI